ncbi:glycosyltransferase family 61 protein [Alphaproteobacteria bacterium KMM 3653]|uniref:Glycosyltransferase family 61 protein n=1 Tax=Harenicola maris TaxID=2841044 RepID=A0AAP2CLE6_9RHOB|nr:glycosyltransferase family 61 protein [Harenicola maris]
MKRIKYKSSPEAFFFHPGVDPGLSFAQAPDWVWKTRPRGRIFGASVSVYPEIEQKINAHMSSIERLKNFSELVVFNTVPAVAEKVHFVKSAMSVRGKWVLSGAAGTRLRNKYAAEQEGTAPEVDENLADFFDAQQKLGAGFPVADWPEDWRDLPFAIESRNTFNYYHFLTETLCQLCSLDDLPEHRGPILIHYPNSEPRAFALALVDALFPELAARVRFVRAPQKYARVLTVFNFRHAYYQTGPEVIPPVDDLAPSGWMWQGRRALRGSMGLLAQNSIDINLLRLRARALAAVEGGDYDHLPRRFWVGRSEEGARDRRMEGEAALLERLAPLGFQSVQFEDLSPLEQVAIMARAEVMISYHGAGFANMLFAAQTAHVIELGTLQTCVFRWGDFMPHAHASGCTYLSFFADHRAEDPKREPVFRVDGIVPVSLSDSGVDQVAGYVSTLLGDPQIATRETLATTYEVLVKIGHGEQAETLLDAHQDWVAGDATLTRLKSECLINKGALEEALIALEEAYVLDPTRHMLLQRMFWVAHKSGQGEKLLEAMEEYKTRFPQKYAAFRKTLGWYKAQPLP